MKQSQAHKLQAAGIDPAYLDELYDQLATKWARKVEAAKRRHER